MGGITFLRQSVMFAVTTLACVLCPFLAGAHGWVTVSVVLKAQVVYWMSVGAGVIFSGLFL